MSDVAQAYLQELAEEREARIRADYARMEAEKQERIAGVRMEYDKVVGKMPVELAEYYSFFSEDASCPLKVSIPLHADFYVGYWNGELKYKDCMYGYSFSSPLSDVINRAKNLYRQPEPEPEADPEPAQAPAEPLLLQPTAIESAKSACEVGHYDKAIAFALIEIAEQLREIDRSLCAN